MESFFKKRESERERSDLWLPEGQGPGEEKLHKDGQRHKLPVTKIYLNTRNVM